MIHRLPNRSNNSGTARLLVFTRYPQPGQAKTRLIPALGPTGAAELQRQMTEHLLAQVKLLQARQSCSVEIWFASAARSTLPAPQMAVQSDLQLMQAWLGSETDQWTYQPQPSGDLGVRLSHACQTAFEAGMEQVVTVGTDCPGLDVARLQQAFGLLQQFDLVLGPATDGGYYLIGLSRFRPELFESIRWGSEVVLQQTVAIAESLGLTIAYLDSLTDVDRPDDLAVWEAVQATCAPEVPSDSTQTAPPQLSVQTGSTQNKQVQNGRPWLSVILPVLNEANSVQATIQALRQAATDTPIEILAVDGGSRDDTVPQLRALGISVLETAAGRAIQMNAGAKAAQGEVLLFLHADTTLPNNFAALVQQTLAQPQTVAGAFDLKIAGSGANSEANSEANFGANFGAKTAAGLRWIERSVWLRSRLLQMPYGDQAIFLRSDTFSALGGFAELPIMEDFDLVQRLKRQGRIAIAPAAVLTSGRRWQQLGVIRTTLINQLVILAYSLGVSPVRIAGWYRSGLRYSGSGPSWTFSKPWTLEQERLTPKRAGADNSDSSHSSN